MGGGRQVQAGCGPCLCGQHWLCTHGGTRRAKQQAWGVVWEAIPRPATKWWVAPPPHARWLARSNKQQQQQQQQQQQLAALHEHGGPGYPGAGGGGACVVASSSSSTVTRPPALRAPVTPPRQRQQQQHHCVLLWCPSCSRPQSRSPCKQAGTNCLRIGTHTRTQRTARLAAHRPRAGAKRMKQTHLRFASAPSIHGHTGKLLHQLLPVLAGPQTYRTQAMTLPFLRNTQPRPPFSAQVWRYAGASCARGQLRRERRRWLRRGGLPHPRWRRWR